MNKLKLAVVGAGHLGRIHAELLAAREDVELVAVVDPVAAAREQTAAKCGAQPCADHRELLDRVDGAVIATPTSCHHDVALDFLHRGLHLLIEKPLASTLAEAERLVKVARRKGAVLQVGHIERFNPALTAAQPYLRAPKYIEGVRAGAFTFRSTDIGVVLDLMIHDIDVVLSVVGEPVEKVSALGLALLGQHEDVAHARLEFAGGCVANLSASRVNSAARRQMQVWGPQGFVDLDFGARTACVTRPSETLLRRELDVEKIPPSERAPLKDQLFEEHLRHETLTVESRNALADELQDFTECIRQLRTPRVNGEQGYQALAVADRVIAAIRNHSWEGTTGGQVGPLATIPLPILRGPHWDRGVQPIRRREAG